MLNSFKLHLDFYHSEMKYYITYIADENFAMQRSLLFVFIISILQFLIIYLQLNHITQFLFLSNQYYFRIGFIIKTWKIHVKNFSFMIKTTKSSNLWSIRKKLYEKFGWLWVLKIKKEIFITLLFQGFYTDSN